MIIFNLVVQNPWAGDNFKSLFVYNKKLTKFKALEIQGMYYPTNILELSLDLTVRRSRSHSGLNVMLGVFGYSLGITFYDSRHAILL